MSRLTQTCLAVAALAACTAGCVGGSSHPSASSSTLIAPCSWIGPGDITAVTHAGSPSKQRLQALPGNRFRCATLLIDGSGHLILQATESTGHRSALSAARRSAEADSAGAVRPLPTLGAGAFVAQPVLAFLHGTRLITLQTGYTGDGQLQLTDDQLAAVARRVAARL